MSFSRMIAAAVFGYDYFISYAHRDGASYATALAETTASNACGFRF
jgi:hypothetical protein